MITTKNNFKGYLRRHYPEIAAYPVYGLPVYILDKPLNPMDTYKYNVQQLPSGKYVVFIGISVQEATELFSKLIKEGIPVNSKPREHDTAPTTFSSFENWLDRHNIKPLNRTFCNDMSPYECFHREDIQGLEQDNEGNLRDIRKKGVWYMYELSASIDNGVLFKHIPHITLNYGDDESHTVLIVLIKAAASRYKSRRQRFLEKFELMRPLYEQLIASCAVAQNEEGDEVGPEWEKAKTLCEQYMNMQFDLTDGFVKIEELMEAYSDGTINLFTRNPGKLYHEDSESF